MVNGETGSAIAAALPVKRHAAVRWLQRCSTHLRLSGDRGSEKTAYLLAAVLCLTSTAAGVGVTPAQQNDAQSSKQQAKLTAGLLLHGWLSRPRLTLR
jgi:hypothetical protein